MIKIKEGLNLTRDGIYIIPTWKDRTICYIGYCENGKLRLPIDGYLPIEDDMYMVSLDSKSNWNINSIIRQLQIMSIKNLPIYLSNYTVVDEYHRAGVHVQDKLVDTDVDSILFKLRIESPITVMPLFKSEFINKYKR